MAIYDKLSTINTALSRTGNNLVGLDDGSPEWIVASDAYDTELPLLIEAHDWGFAKHFASLTQNGSSEHPGYQLSYAKPVDCLQIVDVTLNGYSIDYDIVGANIVACPTYSSTDPFTSTLPIAEYLRQPLPSQWPEHFIEVLRQRLMSHIYRGMNVDQQEADRLYQKSEETLQKAKTRSDQQSPPQKQIVSRMLQARRTPKIGFPYRGR